MSINISNLVTCQIVTLNTVQYGSLSIYSGSDEAGESTDIWPLSVFLRKWRFQKDIKFRWKKGRRARKEYTVFPVVKLFPLKIAFGGWLSRLSEKLFNRKEFFGQGKGKHSIYSGSFKVNKSIDISPISVFLPDCRYHLNIERFYGQAKLSFGRTMATMIEIIITIMAA